MSSFTHPQRSRLDRNIAGSLLILLVLSLQACGSGTQATVPPTSAESSLATPASTDSASSDAPWIVYQAEFEGGVNLGLIHPDGTGDHLIPGGPANRWHPNWSPDGTRIVYDWKLPNDVAQVGVLSLDGSEAERPLLSCLAPCLGHGGPAWSPDGTMIGFDGAESSTPEHDGDLCYLGLLDVESEHVIRFLEHPGCDLQDSYLQFSPDGQHVVFQRGGPQGQAIFTATIDGGDERQLTDWGAWARPDWSPDGEWIVFQDREPESHRGEVVSLHRVRTDGTGLEQLTNPGAGNFDSYPRYLPDGSAILFSRCPGEGEPCETRLIDPDGENDRVLIAPFRYDTVHVIWQPSP
jgi:Tol biopolymer transport system component